MKHATASTGGLGRLALATLVFVSLSCAEAPTEPGLPGDASAAAHLVSLTPPFNGCQQGVQPGGALYEICFPPQWNGDAVVWAHGYVSPLEELAVPDDEVEGIPVPDIINSLRYAYASTSYSKNGLAAAGAVADLDELMDIFTAAAGGPPGHAYLLGASEGALATTLSVERSGTPFDGALGTCGPIGSFRWQVNYLGDFRVVFDFFFPGVIPGSPVDIPADVMAHWEDVYEPAVRAAIAADPHATAQLLAVTGAPTDPNDPMSVAETVVDLLWYNVFATNDARNTLGGSPFDNRFRLYRGSDNDLALNVGVPRLAASPAALAALEAYETSGQLRRPLVTLHTTLDPIVRVGHELIYAYKAWRAGQLGSLTTLPVSRYGHCNFTFAEAVVSFAVLVARVSDQELVASREVFPSAAARQEFIRLSRVHGVNPVLLDDPPIVVR